MSDVDGTSPLVDDDEEGGENDPAFAPDGPGHDPDPALVELHEVLEWEAAKTMGPHG